ncbi:MAG: SPOR domain-containing protein [bacterium]
MNLLRIYFLRIFTSVVFLPFIAIAVLVILHRAVFPNAYFNDLPVVMGLWGLLFLLSNIALSKIGENRFRTLDKLGWNFLQANDSLRLSQVFASLDKLFMGGLLSQKQQLDLEKLLLRRYFSYYHDNIEDARMRAKLIKCFKLSIRQNEVFNALKEYLLKHNMLTLELVDLAEILHEHNPDDQAIIQFMAGQYLQDSQKHHRAEYFYSKILEAGGENAGNIIELCLKRTLSQHRKDTFAGWIYCRAYQNNFTKTHPSLPEQLYKTSLWYEKTQRDDKLASNLSEIVADFHEEMISAWDEVERQRQQKQFSAKIARMQYHVHQQLVFLWDEIKHQRKALYYTSAAMTLALAILILWPSSQTETSSLAKAVNPVIDDSAARFALQVGALKSARSAQREVDRLQKAGIEAIMVKPSGRSQYYRIRLGKFLTKNDALAEGESLRQKKIIRDFFVVNYVKQTE